MADTFLNLKTVAHALGGVISGGQVLAPGPNHSTADRSLSIKLDSNAPDGFVVHSFATNDPITCRDYVRSRLGLPAFKANSIRRRTPDKIEKALQAAVAQPSASKPKGKIIAQYDYRDSGGKLQYQVLRYEPKDFQQRRPNGNGKWIYKLDERRVLYRWPEILKYPDATIFFCEGEKDADRVAELELCTTWVAHGKWTDDCINALTGRDVIILEDNDDAGRKKAFEAATALYGKAKTIRIVSLPGLPDKGDVSDWLDADRNNAKKFVDVCFNVPEWTPETKTNTDEQPSNESKPASELPLPFINIGEWQNRPVPEREWTVKDRIPARNVTLLSGEGSVGKSILSLQVATAGVLGKDWLGSLPEPGPALVVCCEEDTNELWRRLDLIAQHYSVSFADFRDMHLLALAGKDALMAVPDKNGLIQTTKLFGRINEAACDIRPKLIVLDNSADIFGGNENSRAEVRQFIGILRGMAIAAGAGVLLTSHPSLTGISSGSGLSGSTAWNASVRSRLYFKRATTEKDEEPDPDLRVLEVMKSNYGPVGETINLRWKNGLFVPVGGSSHLERLAAEQTTDLLFMDLLTRFNRQGRNVSDKPTSNGYAPNLICQRGRSQNHTRFTICVYRRHATAVCGGQNPR